MIANQLLIHSDQEIRLHGAQLLSKKLNNPPPKHIMPESILNFLYTIPDQLSVIFLCVAKLLLHINPGKACLPEGLLVAEGLKILK